MENGKCRLSLDRRGFLTAEFGGARVFSSPVGLFIADGEAREPAGAEVSEDGGEIAAVVHYDAGRVSLKIIGPGGYFRIAVEEISDNARAFVFGPYFTGKKNYGELVGAAWDDDSAVCIQSLMPKVVGGFPAECEASHKYRASALAGAFDRLKFPECAALPCREGTALQCHARDMSKPARFDFLGMENCEACEVKGGDAFIKGAAVALIMTPLENLLDAIGVMERREGLPHPTVNGEWAKKSPEATRSYFMVSRQTAEGRRAALEWAKKAGLRCVYSLGPFVSWGHFEVDGKLYQGGDDGLKRAVLEARECGIGMGFHTLSNFIHTHDPYVTPVPDDNLLVMDRTALSSDIGEAGDRIAVEKVNNFGRRSHLNVIRIGTELIQYKSLSVSGGENALVGCARGAFGTSAAPHKAGDPVLRLWDHAYMTLFPNLELQNEMARRVGKLIKYTGIGRMSFDGMEGCLYTGRGEYACSEYVRRCFSFSGPELLCDASTPSHYRWHAHSYFNWGEPHWDWQGRGGMFHYRADNQLFFERNLMPRMLGQYNIRLSAPNHASVKTEATGPEDFEFMLGQTVAHNAGFGFDCEQATLEKHGLTPFFLDAIRTWEDLRFNGDIPDHVREKLRNEHADWRLEETSEGWILHRLHLNEFRFHYQEQKCGAENELKEILVFDREVKSLTALAFRLRVGDPDNLGSMNYLAIHDGWGGFDPVMAFDGFEAKGGDYLVYGGGTALDHRDSNYRLIETIEGVGKPYMIGGTLSSADIHWRASAGNTLQPYAKVYHDVEQIAINRKPR